MYKCRRGGIPLYYNLFENGLQTLKNLQLNLGLRNVLLTSAAIGDLLSLGDLGTDSLRGEVLKRVALGGVDAENRVRLDDGEATRQEELLAAAGLLNDLNQARLQLLDRRNVVGEDTHLSGLGGHVDLDDILGLEDGLVRKGQAELDLVGGRIGVASALQRGAQDCRAGAHGGAGDTEGVHGG